MDEETDPSLNISVPSIVELAPDGEVITSDIFSRLMKERIVFISGELGQNGSDIIVAQLLWLDNLNNQKDIKLYINSEGGDITCLFALYDVIQFIKAPVCTYAIGKAFSSAACLLCAGSKGKRYALPNSLIMIHQPRIGSFEGTVSIVDIETKQAKEDKKKMIEMIARHTGNPFSKVEADCEKDYFLNPKQALKYGIIDSVVLPNKEIPPLILEKPIKKK